MNNLSYQPVADADRARYVQNEAQAFNVDSADVARWLNEGATGDMRGLYDGARLVTQCMLFPFTVMIGGGALPCGGIGGVASPPEERRRGYIEQMLRGLCGELGERGTALCMLFPFKTSFYARFGWAVCMERRVYSGTPDLFRSFLEQQHGRFELAGEAQIGELNAIYTEALRGRFGLLVRDEKWWRKDVLSDGKKPYFTYLWRDDSGRGRAYLAYRWEARPHGGKAMICREIVACDPDARAQLFALIANHDSQCSEVVFRAPADAPVNLLLTDPLKCEIEPYFMLRLVDVAAALSAYTYPKLASGRLTIAITDDWLVANNCVFALEVASGVAECRRLPDSTVADLRCDVRLLTQLYSRYLRPRTAAAFGLLDAPNRAALALAEQLFAGLAPFSSDFF